MTKLKTLDLLKDRYAVLKDATSIKVTDNVPRVYGRYLIEILYNDDLCRSFIADSEEELFNTLQHLSDEKSILMTGQEWYNRFVEEYMKLEGQKSGGTIMPRVNAMDAAKLAAGIDHD